MQKVEVVWFVKHTPPCHDQTRGSLRGRGTGPGRVFKRLT